MASVLQQVSLANVTQAASIVRYFFPGSGSLVVNSTEANRAIKCRSAGVCSKLFIEVIASSRAASLRFRKNGADGNQLVSVPSSTTGSFEDASNTDSLADGDTYDYQLTTGSGGTSFTFSAMSHLYAATTNTVQCLCGSIGNNIGATEVVPLNGQQGGTTEAGIQSRITTSLGGTFKKFQAYVSTNTRDGACPVVFRHNGSDAVTFSITASTTGYFEDTSDTEAVDYLDVCSWTVTRGGTTGNCAIQFLVVRFETTNDEFMLITAGGTNSQGPSVSTYYTIMGSVANGSTTEGDSRIPARMAFSLHYLRTYLQTNSISAASSMMLRIDGADSSVTVGIDASTTGEFEDVTAPAGVAASSEICVRLTTGGSGTALAFRNFQMSAAPNTPAAAAGNFFLFM